MISWKSLPGSHIDNAGVVRFEPIMDGKGTRVHVTLRYSPPAGQLGEKIAHLLHEDPQERLEEEMACFKQIMDTGATVEDVIRQT